MILRESVERHKLINELVSAGYFKHTDGRQLHELSIYELRVAVKEGASDA